MSLVKHHLYALTVILPIEAEGLSPHIQSKLWDFFSPQKAIPTFYSIFFQSPSSITHLPSIFKALLGFVIKNLPSFPLKKLKANGGPGDTGPPLPRIPADAYERGYPRRPGSGTRFLRFKVIFCQAYVEKTRQSTKTKGKAEPIWKRHRKDVGE